MYTKMADVPVLGFRNYWTQKLTSLESECHTVTNKYPEVHSDIRTSVMYSAVENEANFCKGLDGIYEEIQILLIRKLRAGKIWVLFPTIQFRVICLLACCLKTKIKMLKIINFLFSIVLVRNLVSHYGKNRD
jgi:hypothetical protein